MFAAAEEALGVPRLIEPNDVVSVPEEKSVMTYVGALFQVLCGEASRYMLRVGRG